MSAGSAARGDTLGTMSRRNFLRIGGGVTAAVGALAATGATVHGAGPARLVAAVDAAQARPEASNMELIGFDDLQARAAYQVLVHQHTTAGSGRWILYVGHHGGEAPNPITGQVEQNGTSVIDVTDATRPVYLAHISGAPGGSEGGGAPRANAVVRRRPRRLVSLSGTRTSAG